MKKLLLALALACTMACGKPVVLPPQQPTHTPIDPPVVSAGMTTFGIVSCDRPPHAGATVDHCDAPIPNVLVKVHTCTPSSGQCSVDTYDEKTTNQDGYALFVEPDTLTKSDITFVKDGYLPQTVGVFLPDFQGQNVVFQLYPIFPVPPTRAYIMGATESFQGAVLMTSQFGRLNWWPTAWTSLNDADRTAAYPQIAAFGDTDITVSISWSYGEAGQPYGDGQIVPNTDLTNNLPRFRALVKDVIQHQAANGMPFVPRIFMEGDNGYNYYMWVMPLVLKALGPQPGDALDLTKYVKLQMCYDSCVPGWQPKTLVGDAVLATRAACPLCVIEMEFSSGYSSTGDGDDFWQSPAGAALDIAGWEGNYWLPTDWEQYWEILDRWLGPLYVKPAQQVSDPDAPFGQHSPKFYLRNDTPRGPHGVDCLEPFTYQWVRGQITRTQSNDAYKTLQTLGCITIDMPTRPQP